MKSKVSQRKEGGWFHAFTSHDSWTNSSEASLLPLRFVEIKGHYLPKWSWAKATERLLTVTNFPIHLQRERERQQQRSLSEAGWAQLKAHRIITFCATDISYKTSLKPDRQVTRFSSQARAKLRVLRKAITLKTTQLSPSLTQKTFDQLRSGSVGKKLR